MTATLFKKGGKRKIQGHYCLRLDCSDDRVDELIEAGWALSPRAAYAPAPAPVPVPEPELAPEAIPLPEPKPKKKKKKSRKKG